MGLLSLRILGRRYSRLLRSTCRLRALLSRSHARSAFARAARLTSPARWPKQSKPRPFACNEPTSARWLRSQRGIGSFLRFHEMLLNFLPSRITHHGWGCSSEWRTTWPRVPSAIPMGFSQSAPLLPADLPLARFQYPAFSTGLKQPKKTPPAGPHDEPELTIDSRVPHHSSSPVSSDRSISTARI